MDVQRRDRVPVEERLAFGTKPKNPRRLATGEVSIADFDLGPACQTCGFLGLKKHLCRPLRQVVTTGSYGSLGLTERPSVRTEGSRNKWAG